ncbi:MAG: diaminopimelate epimerase [Clostridia bacterium]|nr:diaminopimelate epimerase [Clostridia bacterium]
MRFTKMNGLGNDYLYVYAESVPANAPGLSIKYSERHFGAGSDGMIWILPSDKADFQMRIFNADGSEAKMCGNGIRCVGKYVYDKGYTDKTRIKVDTLSGIKTLDMKVAGGKVRSVTVDMGTVSVEDTLLLDVCGDQIRTIPVSVGNPHAVTFVDDAEAVELEKIGPAIERHTAFPGGVNAEFVSVIGENKLRMRVWERGSGITMACGTGACASASAAVSRGLCKPDEKISVLLDGGTLEITVSNDCSVRMTGPAEMIYDGETIDD